MYGLAPDVHSPAATTEAWVGLLQTREVLRLTPRKRQTLLIVML